VNYLRKSICLTGLVVVIFASGLASGVAAAGGDTQRVLDEANDYFQRANEAALTDPGEAGKLYEEAVLRFEYLAGEAELRNGYVFGNLANTYFLAGDLGRAIMNYRRAVEYLPGNAQLRESLAHARDQRVDVFETQERAAWVEWLFFWHYKLDDRTRVALFVTAYALIWVLALWRLFAGRRRQESFRQGVIACLIVCFLAGSSILIKSWGAGDGAAAVLLIDEVEARKGDGFIYEPAFKSALHAGTEVEIIEVRGAWVKGLFGNGEAAWLPREVIGRVEL
jgi:tetratricopeptide (TPR) repeat protein